jgi:phosphoribosylanthranilate isomerase
VNLHTPIIQIAGVHDLAEARLIAEARPDWIGFPFGLPVHEEDCSPEKAAEIIRALPDAIVPVLITYLDRHAPVCTLAHRLGARAVQLHGPISRAETTALRAARPDLILVKALIVRPGAGTELDTDLREFAPVVDAFITDTWDPDTGASGATGKTHDWTVSRRLARAAPKPLILAGGLTPENVARAVETVHPAGVDAHTGVEDPRGFKDAHLLHSFISRARAALAPR